VLLRLVRKPGVGVYLSDPDGRALYVVEDGAGQPVSCTGDCAKQWPPVVLAGDKQPELDGIDPALVGFIQRPDGQRQLTLAGWPLYRHTGDDGGLATTYGNGADKVWYAINPNGDRAKP